MFFIKIIKLFFITLLIQSFVAVASDSLSYSGRLVNANGSPVTGPVNLKFDFVYTNAPTSILCTQQITSVALTNGVFHVKLDPDCTPSNWITVLSGVPAAEALAIRVTDETHTKTYSFQALHSMPLSTLSQVSKQLSQMGATPGQLLAWDGTKWAPTNESGTGNGTVTSVATGAGLTGGPITTTGTISIADGGVTDQKIASGITRSKLANGTASHVLVNDGSGAISSVAQIAVTQGGTGASTAAGARTNLGLGTAAVVDLGTGVGKAMPSDGVPVCFAFEKLQMTAGPAFTWTCVADNDSADNTKLPLDGSVPMTGALDMNAHKILGVTTPTNPGDAANKAYVDAQVGGLTSSQWATNGVGIDYAGGNVGIGTSTPTLKLQVESAGDATIGTKSTANNSYAGMNIYDHNGVNAASFQYGNPSAPSFTNEFVVASRQATIPLKFYQGGVTAGNERIRIDASSQILMLNSNVGIGATTPAEKLDVAGNIALSGKVRMKSDNANYIELQAPTGLAATLNFKFPSTAGAAGNALITNGAGVLSWSTVATGSSAVGGDLTGTIDNAQIAAGAITNAEVAAGAAIAQSKIANLTTDLAAKEPAITAGTALQYWAGDKTWKTLNTAAVPETTNLYFTEPRVLGTDLAGFAATTGAVGAADTVLSAFEKLTGNLAAVSTAQSNYVLKAGDTMTGALILNADPAVALGAATKQYVDSQVSGSTHWSKTGTVVHYNGGRVGIGTSAPTSKLTVAGAAPEAPLVSGDSAIQVFGAGSAYFVGRDVTNDVEFAFGSSTATEAFAGAMSNHDFALRTNNANKVMIKADGKVGIGTNSPNEQLEIYHPNTVANDLVSIYSKVTSAETSLHKAGYSISANAALGFFRVHNDSGDPRLELTVENNGAYLPDLAFYTNASERMRIDNPTGYVGIGTKTPAAILDITSTTSGLLIPRMTTAQRDAIVTPPNGSQIYNTTTNELNYYHTPTTSWKAIGVAGTGVQSITASTGLTPAGAITSSGTIAVDVGTTAGKILQLDGSAKIPAVDGSLITNLNPANLSAVVPISKGGTGLSANGAANTVLGVNAAGNGLEYKALAASSPLSLTHGVGTATVSLGTVPVTKGGTGLTALTGNMFYTANALGTAMQAFSCPLDQIITFNALGEPVCSTVSSMTTYGADGGPTWSANTDGAFIKFRSTGDAAGLSFLEIGTTDNGDEPIIFTQKAIERMRIHTNGYVGIGTAAPTNRLHVHDNTNPNMLVSNTAGTLGALFLGNSSHGLSRGAAGGGLGFAPANNDVTLYTASGKLHLATGATGGTAVPALTVLDDGNVGVGTQAPIRKFTASGSNNPFAIQTGPTNDHVYMEFFARSASPSTRSGFIGYPGAGSIDLSIGNELGGDVVIPNGNLKAQAYLFTSDRRLKKNIKTVHNALDLVLGLRGVEFDWRKTGHHEFGFIAQEVEGIEPNLVVTGRDDGIKAVKYANIVPILVEAMKEQNREIATLKEENKKLKEEIEIIKKHLNIK